MALGNFIMQGSYTVIDCMTYSKQSRRADLTASVYTNSSKANLLTNFSFQCNGSYRAPVLVVGMDTPPASPETGTVFYLIGANATGAWTGHQGAIAHWSGTNWSYPAAGNLSEPLWDRANSRHVQVNADGSLAVVTRHDSWTFDVHFSSNAVNSTSILAIGYQFLKAQPEFIGTADV